MEIYTVLGEKITNADLSKKLKIEEMYLCKVLNKNRRASIPLAKKLCKNIKISFSYLRPDLVPEDWILKIEKNFWVFKKSKRNVYSFIGFFEKKENNIISYRERESAKVIKQINLGEIFCIVSQKQGDILKNKSVGIVK